MPDVNKNKEFFTIDDFNFGKPYMEFRDYDEYHNEVKKQKDLGYGNWNPEIRKNEDFIAIKMSAWFKNDEDDRLLESLLHLDPQADEHVSDIYVEWYGNKEYLPYIFASVFDYDLCERGCSVPMEDGSSEKFMDMIDRAINKTDLERFCEHLDEIGEKWSYVNDSKTGIECSYMNGGKPYQVYADGFYLHFENADTFMFEKDTSDKLGINDVVEQEEKFKTVVATLLTDDGRTLSIHDICSNKLLTSENGQNPQWCKFEHDIDGSSVIDFKTDGKISPAHFKIYLDLGDFYKSEAWLEPLNFKVTQDENINLKHSVAPSIYSKNDLDNNENIIFSIYKIDENKHALIGGSWFGIPMKAEWVEPEVFTEGEVDAGSYEGEVGYDISDKERIVIINQEDIFNSLNSKQTQVVGMYRFDKNNSFIIHAYGESDNGCKTALIGEQKDGQVVSAQWCKSDIPVDGSKEGKFYFEKNGKNVLIPSDKIKPYRESFAEKVKGIQKSVAKQINANKGDKASEKEEAIS